MADMPRILRVDDLRPLLAIGPLIEPMRQAFRQASLGRSASPIAVLHPTAKSDMHVKSATLDGAPIFTVKMAGWSQDRADRGLPPTTGMIAVYDSATCELRALLDDEHLISDYRTAAAGALVADALARSDASTLTVVGTGAQARLQAEAVCLVRDIDRVLFWGRDAEKAGALAADLAATLGKPTVTNAADLGAATAASDVIVCATAAKDPVLRGEWLRPGQHVTSVGSDDATKAELSADCFARADLVVVDSLDAAGRYGSLARAAFSREGGIEGRTQAPVAEIGTLLNEGRLRREAPDHITVASLVGLGVQDLAAILALKDKLW